MGQEQTKLDFSWEEGPQKKPSESPLRIVKSMESSMNNEERAEIAQKYGIIGDAVNYINKREGIVYYENEPIEEWNQRMNDLDEPDEYYKGYN